MPVLSVSTVRSVVGSLPDRRQRRFRRFLTPLQFKLTENESETETKTKTKERRKVVEEEEEDEEEEGDGPPRETGPKRS
jgi:hypothetical protein